MGETAATTLYRMAWTTKKDKDSFIREVCKRRLRFGRMLPYNTTQKAY